MDINFLENRRGWLEAGSQILTEQLGKWGNRSIRFIQENHLSPVAVIGANILMIEGVIKLLEVWNEWVADSDNLEDLKDNVLGERRYEHLQFIGFANAFILPLVGLNVGLFNKLFPSGASWLTIFTTAAFVSSYFGYRLSALKNSDD